MTKEYRQVAILGAGYIADYHLQALRLIPEIQVVALCDLNEGRARQIASGAGIDNVYTDLEQMLKQENLDCVHVLTPPAGHFAPARQILEAGVSAYLEKPLCATATECAELTRIAQENKVALGVSHNFLCAEPYEELLTDLREQRLGRLDQIDIVWNKPLPQLKSGPFSTWLFARPENILLEVAPHSFAHALHLAGELENLVVDPSDPVELPGGRRFYRRWEIRGQHERTHVRLLFNFNDGYTEHYIALRGTSASARVDFESNTYLRSAHTQEQPDLDRFTATLNASCSAIKQSTRTLVNFALSKAGRRYAAGPFADSIARAVQLFYSGLEQQCDERLDGHIGTAAVAMAERVAAQLPAISPALHENREPELSAPMPIAQSTVLVTGGTGFIGKALIARLRRDGHGVRVLSRSPDSHRSLFAALGVELVRGDMLDQESLNAALDGIDHVYHLARGNGITWDDYLHTDVEPTRRLAESCLARGIQLIYASSIAIYAPGSASKRIEANSPPHSDQLRTNIYARAKAECEDLLNQLHSASGLNMVIVRPGIVIGDGGSPFHAGIGAFPHSSVCRLYGTGENRLPIVLVDDCADAMARIIDPVRKDAADLSGEHFNLVGDPLLTARQYLDEIERCAGVKIERISTSAWRTYLEEMAKWMIKILGRDPQRRKPSLVSIRGRAHRSFFDPTHAMAKLDWQPTRELKTLIHKGIQIPVQQYVD